MNDATAIKTAAVQLEIGLEAGTVVVTRPTVANILQADMVDSRVLVHRQLVVWTSLGVEVRAAVMIGIRAVRPDAHPVLDHLVLDRHESAMERKRTVALPPVIRGTSANKLKKTCQILLRGRAKRPEIRQRWRKNTI